MAPHVHATNGRRLSDLEAPGSRAQRLRCIILAHVILLWVCRRQDLTFAVVRLYQDYPPLWVLLQRSIGTVSAALTAALQVVNGDKPPPVGCLECNRRFSVLGGRGRHLWPLGLGTCASQAVPSARRQLHSCSGSHLPT